MRPERITEALQQLAPLATKAWPSLSDWCHRGYEIAGRYELKESSPKELRNSFEFGGDRLFASRQDL